MAVIDTAPETLRTHGSVDHVRAEPTGFAAVLGTGDHKVVGRLYVATSLLLGVIVVVLGLLFSIESTNTKSLSIFSDDTVFQFWTLYRLGGVFLVAFPLVIGIAMVVVPLQVGSKAIAFPRAAAASYWAFLLGAVLFVLSYAINGGPGGGRSNGVTLWITSLGLIMLAILLAAVCLATTVLALRQTGLTMDRVPMFAWSVFVAASMWLLTLPVMLGVLALMYVDHRHAGTSFGKNSAMFDNLAWVLRNPQIYVVSIPVLGFAADVLATSAKARVQPRWAAQAAVGAFGVFSFGAFLVGADAQQHKAWVVIALGLAAVLPVLAVAGLVGDLFRRGSFTFGPAVVSAAVSLAILMLAVIAGAIGSIPGLETYGTIFDLGVTSATLLSVLIAMLGGVTWWASKIGRQPAATAPATLAPFLLLIGSIAVVIPYLAAGVVGHGPPSTEQVASWEGGIGWLNAVGGLGMLLVVAGVIVSLIAFVPLVKETSEPSEADPWEGQSLEWLTPSPPPLDNFDIELPVVKSAEPLIDLREEA